MCQRSRTRSQLDPARCVQETGPRPTSGLRQSAYDRSLSIVIETCSSDASPSRIFQTQPLPKYTSSAAQNAFKSLLTPYSDYVAAFHSLDKTKLLAAREKAREIFTRVRDCLNPKPGGGICIRGLTRLSCRDQDHNLGLVTLVEQSLRRRVIQKLTQTWSTLSLGHLTKLVGMDDKDDAQVAAVESEVLGMVSLNQQSR